MKQTTLYIKNMVCNRCVWAVERELKKIGLNPLKVILGEATVEGTIEQNKVDLIRKNLLQIGFELIDDKKGRLLESIRTEVIKYIHYDAEMKSKLNFSTYLSEKLGYDYSYLSTLFSSMEGITLEKYIILQRTEKVKELLVYDELTLSEIAYQAGYSSVQHLSSQFKKTVGMSPSQFKKLQLRNRKPLDKVE